MSLPLISKDADSELYCGIPLRVGLDQLQDPVVAVEEVIPGTESPGSYNSFVYLFPAKNAKKRAALSRSRGEDFWPIGAIADAAVMPAPAFEQFRQHVRYCAWGIRDVRVGHFSMRSRVFR